MNGETQFESPVEIEGCLIVPRKPDPGTDEQQAYIRGKNEEEKKKIKAVKEICARNNIEVRDVLMIGIDKFLRDHHWPPGNSQTVLPVFDVKPALPQLMCGLAFCNKPAEYMMFKGHEKLYRCSEHKHYQLPWKQYASEKIKKR